MLYIQSGSGLCDRAKVVFNVKRLFSRIFGFFLDFWFLGFGFSACTMVVATDSNGAFQTKQNKKD